MNNMERINELHAKIGQELINKEALIKTRDYLEFKDADTTEVEAELAETRASIKAMRKELEALLDTDAVNEKEEEPQAEIKQKFETKQPLLHEQERETKVCIDFDTFLQQYNAAKGCDSSDKFIIRPWESWMPHTADRVSVVDLLSYIYDVSKNGFNEIVKRYKTLKEMSDKFNIPYSTMQKWAAERATPPEYLLTMMAYITIIK